MTDSHYKTEAAKLARPRCPKCGAIARESETRFGFRNSCCGLRSWDRHPLVDEATHEARKAASEALSSLWGDGTITKRKAYDLLADALGISSKDCHIKLMDRETAESVPVAVQEILSTL